ncbi:DUF6607 family protein [Parahaliea aestuarii]|uniref:DUF1329 domain-containing protein n=1 Tax=Parahaliea aestuarii TaxID=1852021 RepID=A0A5C8ZX05_9GAMM|nr:DUF6607 family protein [Parahaliea aestuarii]TXS92379.1 hypothetical protein FVW59_08120 [Parahaliea aestuarii]
MPGLTIAGALLTLLAVSGAGRVVAENPSQTTGQAPEQRQYTYAWPYTAKGDMAPRGGTSTGSNVTLVKEPSAAWQALQAGGLSAKERDRRAILAMAGPYRASFDFIETVGFTPDYTPPRPYQSWGTEFVYVLADEPDFISLQHIMVMKFEMPDGTESEPVVIKHWRQDWRYQDRLLNVFIGDGTWEQRKLGESEVAGAWSQAVFQVDDSPRYEGIGRWQHSPGYSSWQSDTTWRPLPRREFSVRDDYDALAGTNRHTITPTGWIHEEDNLKLVLAGRGEPATGQPYLAREAGFNRYERIRDHDFSAGDEYWERTGSFWADVRKAWDRLLASNARVTLLEESEGEKLFSVMFEYADGISAKQPYDSSAGNAFIAETLARFSSR